MRKIEQVLFDGDDEFFKIFVKRAHVYAEYGAGESTLWVSENTDCVIYSVDSSIVWADRVNSLIGNRGGVAVTHVDVGPVGEWGYPLGYTKSYNFKSYHEVVWQQDKKPDLVLIDGRFRVCCFLMSLLNSDPDTIIVFDDYRDRTEYHIVEKYIKPIAMCGRQALFKTYKLGDLERNKIMLDMESFRSNFY